MKSKKTTYFNSLDTFKREYFPNAYAAENNEDMKSQSVGTRLARKSLEEIKSRLPKIGIK